MADIAENLARIERVANQSVYGNMRDHIKIRAGFVVGGGAVGFFYAASQQRNWVPYTLGGLVLGGVISWIYSNVKPDSD